MKKILIVEDEPAIAQEIAINLEQRGFEVSDIAHSSEQALASLYSDKPDVILLDINIDGNKNGIEVAHIINEKYKIPFIYLTSFSDPETIATASATFPYGYIVKPFKDEDIAPAIHMALAKHTKDSSQGLPSLAEINLKVMDKITEAEYRIIALAWKGMDNSEIAKEAFLSINTVKSHIQRVYSKLQVKNKAQLLYRLREINNEGITSIN